MSLSNILTPNNYNLYCNTITSSANNAASGFTFDAFQRLRTGNPYTMLALKQTANDISLFYDNQETSGTGTGSVYNQNRASTILSVGANTAGTRVFQSKLRGIYQPGLSLDALLTGVIGDKASGITKRWGYFDDKNGLFFEQDDNTIYIVRRTFVTGAAVDTRISQDNWNIDSLDGNGSSGITLDTTKSNIYAVSFEWLGVGQVTYSLNINGITIPIHQINNANDLDAVFMSNPNLPIRYEITNDGTGPASTLETICGVIISNGGIYNSTKTTSVSRAGIPYTLGLQDVYTPILSVRLKSGEISTRADIESYQTMLTTTDNYQTILILNPTITGTNTPTWVPISNSSLEYDISRTNAAIVDITSGHIIGTGYGSSSNQVKSALGSAVTSFLTLGSNIDGSSDEIVLAVANIDSNGGTAYANFTFTEAI